jgi:hypothetical protein
MPTKRTANRCVKSPTVTEPAPAPAPQCFMQPCSGRQVTLRVLNCLPHMTACYLHATDIVAMLKHDYPDICLEPLSYRGASTHRQSPISACAAPRGPLAAPSAPVPHTPVPAARKLRQARQPDHTLHLGCRQERVVLVPIMPIQHR